MTSHFMETPIEREGYKVTVEFEVSGGEPASYWHPGDPYEFEIVAAFIDDDNCEIEDPKLTDDEYEKAYEYLDENYVYEPDYGPDDD